MNRLRRGAVRTMRFDFHYTPEGWRLSEVNSGAILVQSGSWTPQADLAHTLRRWEEGGLSLAALDLSAPAVNPEPLSIPRPSWFRAAWYRALATAGFQRGILGGFGGILGEGSGG